MLAPALLLQLAAFAPARAAARPGARAVARSVARVAAAALPAPEPAAPPLGPLPASQQQYITPEMDKHLVAGIDNLYRMRFREAEDEANQAIALKPEHPHAYLGLAGVAWTEYVYGQNQDDPRLMAEFEKRALKAIDVAEKWNKAHPDDAGGLMTLGAAYGIWSRLLINQHSWVKGYFKGRTALKLTKQAALKDPQLWDAYLGLGMYDYYSDLYPRFVGALAKIVLRGDRAKGIEELEMVSEKGHFSQSNAKILLVEIHCEDPFGAKDGKKAVALMKELRARYPDSSMMHSAETVALFTAGEYEKSAEDAREYIRLVREGKYNAIELGKGYSELASSLWALKRNDEAMKEFESVLALRRPDGRMTRWAQWAHIQAGNMLDSMGKRAEAVALYKKMLAEPDTWDFHELARPFLSKPYADPAPQLIAPL
jgi:tetratricopeptide (TPR) repeat protein